jgi:hypothetical protein
VRVRGMFVGGAAALVLAVVGCGGSSKTSSTTSRAPNTHGATTTAVGASGPRQAALAYLSAFGNRNPTALCSTYAPQLQRALAAGTGSCPAFFSRVFALAAKNACATRLLNAAKSPSILSVVSNSTNAQVRFTFAGLARPGLLLLVNRGGGWLVTRAPNTTGTQCP